MDVGTERGGHRAVRGPVGTGGVAGPRVVGCHGLQRGAGPGGPPAGRPGDPPRPAAACQRPRVVADVAQRPVPGDRPRPPPRQEPRRPVARRGLLRSPRRGRAVGWGGDPAAGGWHGAAPLGLPGGHPPVRRPVHHRRLRHLAGPRQALQQLGRRDRSDAAREGRAPPLRDGAQLEEALGFVLLWGGGMAFAAACLALAGPHPASTATGAEATA